MNATTVNDAIESSRGAEHSDENNIVGLMEQERWPVLRVEFPSKPFPNSMLSDFFEGNFSAYSYIEQMSGGKCTLEVTIIDEVWQSPIADTYWGVDSSDERDVGSDQGGAMELAKQAITSVMSDLDLASWDLDGDFVIDRLLILHSGQPQELGGPSNRIWSHFSSFSESVIIGDYTIEHYTMASIHGGLGVVVHEMLHQMGAVDLYDVHSNSPTKTWHGLGDWDIMASGNWIGDGNMPSLPSASTLNIIGGIDPMHIETTTDRNITIYPISEGGSPLLIHIAPDEIIWVTLRSDIGFDEGLPGHGILVEQQDLGFGDIETNLVNTDPTRPWAKIIEADGDDGLLRGRDHGSIGDVFTVGEIIGEGGHQIWDNHGRQVPWRISVTSVESASATIEYDFLGDENTNVSMPRNPLVMLPNETAFAKVNTDPDCIITSELTESNDMLLPTFNGHSDLVPILEISDTSIPKGTISGFIGCQGRPMTSISIDWYLIGHRLSNETIEANIPWNQPSTLRLYPNSVGDNPMNYRMTIDGPASRVASVLTTGTYFPGDPIMIEINPDGLLEPRMIARGDLIIIDSNNIEHRIPIVLNSDADYPFGPINWLTVPSNAITAVLILLAFSIASGHRKIAIDE
tara:strand:+ start:2328 stop:4217 length:1890 start_codon:yes stop_codon:yes gene_type:complete